MRLTPEEKEAKKALSLNRKMKWLINIKMLRKLKRRLEYRASKEITDKVKGIIFLGTHEEIVQPIRRQLLDVRLDFHINGLAKGEN